MIGEKGFWLLFYGTVFASFGTGCLIQLRLNQTWGFGSFFIFLGILMIFIYDVFLRKSHREEKEAKK